MIISFVIFNKNMLNLFNLDIGSVLSYFLVFNLLKYNHYFKLIFILVCSVRMFDFLVFSVKTKNYYYLFIFMLEILDNGHVEPMVSYHSL